MRERFAIWSAHPLARPLAMLIKFDLNATNKDRRRESGPIIIAIEAPDRMLCAFYADLMVLPASRTEEGDATAFDDA